MSTVEEIEAAIQHLPREQFFQLVTRLRDRFGDEWDRQIAEDAAAGKLDALASEAIAEHGAGKATPFPSDAQPSDQ